MTPEHHESFNTTQNTEPKLAIAMAAMLGRKTPYLPFVPISIYRAIAERAGVKLDYWPIRPLPETQALFGLISDKDLWAISSASSSFRPERTLKAAWQHPDKKLALSAMASLPHRDNLSALRQLAHFKKRQDKDFCVVVYPQTPTVELVTLYAPRLVQPTREEFQKHAVNTPADLDRYLKSLRVQGFCFDTLHSRFLFTNPQYRHLFEHVIVRTRLVHASVGRTDTDRADAPNNQTELDDFLTVNKTSEIATLLKAIQGLGYKHGFVFKVPSDVAPGGLILTPSKLSSFYSALVDCFKEIIQ